MKYRNGNDFLNKLYSNMHMEDIVMYTAEAKDTPSEKIEKYLDRLERVHNKARLSEHRMNVLKSFYYDKYVVKELPESYIKQLGNNKTYSEMLQQVQNDQKESLDIWIDYLTSDSADYPIWFKSYVFQGMLKLNKFDKETLSFGRRTDSTLHPYIELNEEVISKIYDALSSEIGEQSITSDYEEALSNGESFKKLYTYYFFNESNVIKNTDENGIWVKYDQGSDSNKLCDSIQGKNTGWCIAGYDTAKNYLNDNDMYIYYTKDDDNKFTIPRIAIRVENHNTIGEIRGVLRLQEMEDSMLDVVDRKIDEFSNAEEYRKRVNDMKKLAQLDEKRQNKADFSLEDLIFIYEIDSDVKTFGGYVDPRLERLKYGRDVISDLNKIFEVRNKIKGSINLKNIEDITNLNLPDEVNNLYLPDISDPEKLKLPKIVHGNLNLDKLKTLGNVKLPEIVEGCLNLSHLEDCSNLKLPKVLGGLNSSNLKSIKGLEFPKELTGDLILSDIERLDGVALPEKIGGSLILSKLTDTTGLNIPRYLGGDLFLNKVISVKDLELPEEMDGSLVLRDLTLTEGLKLPTKVGGSIFLDNITSAHDIVFPKEIGYNSIGYTKIWLNNIEDKELNVPESYLKNDVVFVCPTTKIVYVDDNEYFKNKSINGMFNEENEIKEVPSISK